ncbi:MAG: regulator of chromosome condensation [Ilumatobacteraceae bacterium]|nr:regulator of chromosome condensation [Ilumatobacteraceae bacterium]
MPLIVTRSGRRTKVNRTGAPRRGVSTWVAVVALTVGTGLAFSNAAVHAAGSTPLSTGLNADGQLGNGTTTQRLTAGAVSVSNIVQVASGREHAYALDDHGRVWAWGDNSKNAVGDGTSTDRRTPAVVLTGVAEVEAGHYHGIALKTDGTVWTWGFGSLGQLGLGTTNNRSLPTKVPSISGAIAVAAGRDMSYVLLSDHTVMAFGGNTYGEVGDGTTARRNSPVKVSGLTDVVRIVGGRNHGLALKADGTLWAWGANEYNELGDGTSTQRTTPVQVLTNVKSMDAGAEHSLAVMNDGTVRTWGRGYRGELGLGNTASRSTPTAVPGLTGIVQVGDGRDQSFAMNAAGAVWAWGYNDTGQLGDGTTTQRNSPLRITALTGIGSAQGGRGMTIFLPIQSGGGPGPDVTPPTAPGKPTGTSSVPGRADLTWAPATDDRATTLTYQVYRDGGFAGQVASSAATVTFADTTLEQGSTHTWTVVASDGVNTGPASAASDPVTVASGGTGTPPTELVSIDFSAGLSGFTGVTRLAVDDTMGSPTDAAPSAKVGVVNQTGTGQVALATNATQACTSVDVRVASVTGTDLYSLIKLRSATGASIGRVQISTAGKLSVRADVSGAVLATTATVAVNAWNRITLCVAVGAGTTGQLQLRLNGTTLNTWAANTGTSPLAKIQVGDNDARTATVNWDDLVVTDGLT